MTRHPVKSVSDLVYEPYNAIGTFVSGGQAIFSKAGDYLNAISKGDAFSGLNEQISKDYNALAGTVTSEINYYANTPKAKIASDAKAFFTNPDNYFHAAEDAFGVIATGKLLPGGVSPSVPKINIAESFSLKGAETAVADGSFYSVAYEVKLPINLYPGRSYAVHFSAANKALHAAMSSDEAFSSAMSELGMTFKRTKTGAIDWARSPDNFVWHHHTETGILQLVPKVQHTTNSMFWKTLHPGGVGGMSLWGNK